VILEKFLKKEISWESDFGEISKKGNFDGLHKQGL